MMADNPMIAPCGINCSECSIFIAANDPQAAEKLAAQWRETWLPDAKADWFKCRGCRDDRSVCWSEDCKIYACCMEEKKLDFCYLCDAFPCAELEKWGAESVNHVKALEWLKEMRGEQSC